MAIVGRAKASRAIRFMFVDLLRHGGDDRKHHPMRLFLPHSHPHAPRYCLIERLLLHTVAVEESLLPGLDEFASVNADAVASRAVACQQRACLCDHSQEYKGLSIMDEAAASEKISLFMGNVVVTVPEEVSNGKANVEISQKCEEVNGSEHLLQSIGVPRKKLSEVMSAFITDADKGTDLHHTVSVLENIGFPRKKIWSLIKREKQLIEVSAKDMASNIQTLEEYGVKKEDFRKVVQRCPFILSGNLEEALAPLARELEGLGVESKRIIRLNLEYNAQRLIFSGMAKLQELTNIYTQHGLAVPELAKALRQYPCLLVFVSESNWIKSVDYLKSLSIEDEDFNQLIKRNPPLVTCSIQSNLKPKIEFLVSIGVSKPNLPRILKRCPTFFCCSIEKNLKPKMKYLQSLGMQGNDLGRMVALRPSLLGRSLTKGFTEKVNFLMLLGFEIGSPQFVRALGCLFSTSTETLESRIKQLKELGFSLGEIFLMVKRNPNLLSTSNKQFHAKIEFLMNIMKRSLKDLVSYPVYFNLNLEGRIIPRHRVLSWLRSNGLTNKSFSLSHIVALSEKRFQQKFIEKFPGSVAVYEEHKTSQPLVGST